MENSDVNFEELQHLYNKFKKSQFLWRKNCSRDVESEEQQINNEYFKALMERLNSILPTLTERSDLHLKILAMKSSLLYDQSKLLMLIESFNRSKVLLQNALSVITEFRKNRYITFLYMRLINHLAYLFSKDSNYEESRLLLESVADIDEFNEMLIYNTDELFSTQEMDQTDAKSKFNKLIANNLEMLAWVYGKLNSHNIHAAKQHLALQKQLEVGELEPIAWCNRCLKLATLYLAGCAWNSARYHLVAAEVVLRRLENEVVDRTEFARVWADLARAWIHYGLHLFGNSKLYFTDRKYRGNFNNGDKMLGECPTEESAVELSFPGLDIITLGIPAEVVNCTEDARKLFSHTHEWLKQANIHYNLRDFPIRYVNTVLDLSELLRFLAFYEPDLDSQYDVQKRRADALETLSCVLRETRPQCYAAVSVELLRELAEVQIEMMAINLKRLQIGASEDGDSACRIERRISAISHIQSKLANVEVEKHALYTDVNANNGEAA